MKKIRFVAGLLFIFLAGYSTVQAQKSFEGIVVYDITYPESDLEQDIMAMLPDKMTTRISGTYKSNETLSAMSNQVEITNSEDMSRIILIDVMGQKFAIESTKEEIEKENAETGDPVIQYLDDTREIAGYTCKKALVTTKDDRGKEHEMEVYYTEELITDDLFFEGKLRNLKGLPLEYTITTDQMKMVFTASEIKKGGVKKKDFEVPDDYKYVTEDELKNMFGG